MAYGPHIAETGQALSIGELVYKEPVTAPEVLATLAEHADSGSHIIGNAILAPLERCEPAPTEEELLTIQETAQRGIVAQARKLPVLGFETVIAEQAQYARVIGHVGLMLESQQQSQQSSSIAA